MFDRVVNMPVLIQDHYIQIRASKTCLSLEVTAEVNYYLMNTN